MIFRLSRTAADSCFLFQSCALQMIRPCPPLPNTSGKVKYVSAATGIKWCHGLLVLIEMPVSKSTTTGTLLILWSNSHSAHQSHRIVRSKKLTSNSTVTRICTSRKGTEKRSSYFETCHGVKWKRLDSASAFVVQTSSNE
jgi:hypothetical protein